MFHVKPGRRFRRTDLRREVTVVSDPAVSLRRMPSHPCSPLGLSTSLWAPLAVSDALRLSVDCRLLVCRRSVHADTRPNSRFPDAGG